MSRCNEYLMTFCSARPGLSPEQGGWTLACLLGPLIAVLLECRVQTSLCPLMQLKCP